MKQPFGQQQMQRMRQRLAEGAYWEQQQRQKHEEEARRRQNSERFRQVQREAAELRRRRETGQISDADFREAMRKLTFQDSAGNWWAVGLKSGDWHRHDGKTWTREGPPDFIGPQVPHARDVPIVPGVEPHPVRAFFRFVLTLMFMGALSFGAAVAVDGLRMPVEPIVVFSAGLVVGFIAAILRARRSYRGD